MVTTTMKRAADPNPPSTPAPLPLEATAITKSFRRASGEVVHALDDVSLRVEPGEMIVLLGPSGCGKTTLLRCVAGLEYPDSGVMHLAGRPVYDRSAKIALPANRRDINMMFQSYALWPHMTLVDNVAYPLRVMGQKRKAARSRAMEYLDLVGIGSLGTQYASQVSGGQQQRAALARTLVSEPALVLFDEPLSNVDAKVRYQLRAEISRLHHELRFAALYVTHDQSEAMALGDRVAVMSAGKIQEFSRPTELYARPQTRFVAEFLGSANIVSASVVERVAEASIAVAGEAIGRLVLPARPDILAASDSTVSIMWRPENSRMTAGDSPAGQGEAAVSGRVVDAVYAGPHTDYTIELVNGAETIHALVPGMESFSAFQLGDPVTVHVPLPSIQLVAG